MKNKKKKQQIRIVNGVACLTMYEWYNLLSNVRVSFYVCSTAKNKNQIK